MASFLLREPDPGSDVHLFRPYTALHSNAVIQPGLLQQLAVADHSAGLGLSGTKYQPTDTPVHYGAGTHGARFYSDIQIRPHQAVIADRRRRFAQRHDLGMGSGIMTADGPVPAAPDNLAIQHHHRTDRHLIQRIGLHGHQQCLIHPALVKLSLLVNHTLSCRRSCASLRSRHTVHKKARSSGLLNQLVSDHSHSMVAGGLLDTS
jgi:hypothetical protein